MESVKYIDEKGGPEWLRGLRGQPAETIREELLEMKGVGRKVADCIALFSLDCASITPVDTHVF